jgi:hypothetical protein
LCFDRTELDKVLADGDHKRGRGRPKKGWKSPFHYFAKTSKQIACFQHQNSIANR